MMTRDELFTLHKEICARALSLMEKKNRDYSIGDDPFGNFRATSILNIKPELGILMRCIDKIKRIETFIKSGTLENEAVIDSIVDIINYMVLLEGMLMEKECDG